MPARLPPRTGFRPERRDRAGTLGACAGALGQKLLGEVIDYAKVHKALPAKPQDEQFATLAPNLAPAKHYLP